MIKLFKIFILLSLGLWISCVCHKDIGCNYPDPAPGFDKEGNIIYIKE